MSIQIKDFGKTTAGQPVKVGILANDTIEVHILSYGATIQQLLVPDRKGNKVDAQQNERPKSAHEQNYRKHPEKNQGVVDQAALKFLVFHGFSFLVVTKKRTWEIFIPHVRFFVRVNHLCVGTLACSLLIKKRIGAAEGLIAGEVVTLLRGRLCRRLRGRLIRRRCLLCGISVVLCVFAGRAVFDLVHDDDRGTPFFRGSWNLPTHPRPTGQEC